MYLQQVQNNQKRLFGYRRCSEIINKASASVLGHSLHQYRVHLSTDPGMYAGIISSRTARLSGSSRIMVSCTSHTRKIPSLNIHLDRPFLVCLYSAREFYLYVSACMIMHLTQIHESRIMISGPSIRTRPPCILASKNHPFKKQAWLLLHLAIAKITSELWSLLNCWVRLWRDPGLWTSSLCEADSKISTQPQIYHSAPLIENSYRKAVLSGRVYIRISSSCIFVEPITREQCRSVRHHRRCVTDKMMLFDFNLARALDVVIPLEKIGVVIWSAWLIEGRDTGKW